MTDPGDPRNTGSLGRRAAFELVCRHVYRSGGVGDEEQERLEELQQALRLDPQVAGDLLKRAKRAIRGGEGAPSSLEEVLRRACEVAWADGEVTRRERKILTALADALGIPRSDVEHLLQEFSPGSPAPASPQGTPDPTPPAPPSLGPGRTPPAPEASSAAAASTAPRKRSTRLALGAGAVLLGGLLAAGLAGWWARGRIQEVKDDPTLTAEVLPPQGEATEADEVLHAVMEVMPRLTQEDALWGFGWGQEVHPNPEAEEARRVLEGSARLREVLVTRLVASLEPEGHGVVLQRRHDYQKNRRLHNRLAGDVLSLVLLGRHGEAVELAAAKDRHARLLGRGIQNSPNLIAWMIGMSCRKTLDRGLAAALERGLLPPPVRDRFAEIYRDSEEREVPLEVPMRAEFAMGRRAVRAFDRRLGLLQYPMRLWWGNGLSTVDALEARMEAGRPPPGYEEAKRWHVMLRITLPNSVGARPRWEAYLTARRELLEALEG